MSEPKPPEKLSIAEEKGYEYLVKQMQRYLLYVLPELTETAYDSGHLNYYEVASLASSIEGSKRLKKVSVSDTSANTNLLASLARTANIKFMRKIPPNVLAGLMPLIKVYKVNYPSGLKDKTSPNDTFLVPFDDGIIPIGASYLGTTGVDSAGVARTPVPYTVESELLGNHKGALDMATLVSFDYQFIGTNPAETETSITAKMKLKFTSVDALLAHRTLIGETPDKTLPDFTYADLVNSAARESPNYYRLKVKVGYQKVSEQYIKTLLGPSANNVYGAVSVNQLAMELTNAINESNVMLFIYPVSHELNFNENGTIDLSVNYHGAIESSMVSSESNVLLVSARGKTLYDAIKVIKDEKEAELKALRERYDAEHRAKDDDYEKQREEITKKQDKKLEEKFKDLHIIYEDFLETLYNSGKVRSIKFIAEGIEDRWAFFGNADTVEDRGNAGAEAPLNNETPPSLEYSTHAPGDAVIAARVQAIKESVQKNTPNPQTSGGGSAGSNPGPGISIGANVPDRVNFIFMQDIILYVLQVLGYESLAVDDIYLILGNIVVPTARKTYSTIISTAVGLGVEGVSLDAGGSSNTFSIMNSLNPLDPTLREKIVMLQYNIGTLPVSLEYFNKWFFNTVIKTSKTDWRLKNFLYDLMELIRLSVANIFGTQLFGAPGSRTLLGAVTVAKDYGLKLYNTRQEEIDFADLSGINVFNESNDIANVLYLFIPTLITNQINPLDVVRNEELNVFTFTVGSNVGLLKKVNYKKMDIAGAREARIDQAGETPQGILRMKYDADLEMYGPCYFRPGDIVVINPTFLSKSSIGEGVTALADSLGLGGVFMVLKTNTDVSREGIKTNLETVFQSYGTLKIRPLTSPGGS